MAKHEEMLISLKLKTCKLKHEKKKKELALKNWVFNGYAAYWERRKSQNKKEVLANWSS